MEERIITKEEAKKCLEILLNSIQILGTYCKQNDFDTNCFMLTGYFEGKIISAMAGSVLGNTSSLYSSFLENEKFRAVIEHINMAVELEEDGKNPFEICNN